MHCLFTIGYEGVASASFLETLVAAEVDCLVDVREAPVSRRADFSKRALEAMLWQRGIAYQHEPRLGAPKALREGVKTEPSYTRFFEDYGDHLRANEDVLDRLVIQLTGAPALMCYERDHRSCHRLLVADALATRAQLVPQHLAPPPTV